MNAPAHNLDTSDPPSNSARLLRSRLQLWATLRAHRIAILLVAAMAVLLVTSMQSESPTTDEPLHLTRGLSYYWGPDASLSYSHPPLGNAFAALTIALRERRVDVASLQGFETGEVWTLARRLLGTDYHERRAWFFEARAMVAVLCLALALYVYQLTARLFGRSAGVWALVFLAFHPTVIAHGRLVTTDLPVTLAMVVAAGELVLFLVGGSRWHGALAATAVGVALVTKYSGFLLIPLSVAAVAITAVLRVGRYRNLTFTRSIAAAAVYVLVSALGSVFIINAAYRFERTGLTAAEMLSLPEPAPTEPRGFGGDVLDKYSPLPSLPPSLPIPLPYTYVFGVSVLRAHGGDGHPTTFFGEPMRHGHFAYFPVMLLIKTPLPLMAAVVFAGIVFVRRRGRVSLAALLLAAYAAGVVLIATRASINIGVRHVLPMIPVLALIGGVGFAHALRALPSGRARQWLARATVLASVGGVVWSFPDYLSDFNLLVGGKAGGERISIVGEEWGQDTARFAKALRARGIREVYFSGDSFTSRLELLRQRVKPKRLGCPDVLPSNAYVAVQARDLARQRDSCARWARDRTPAFDVNGHVFVYRTGPAEQPF